MYQDYRFYQAKLGVILLNLGIFFSPAAVVAAEKIYLDYGPLQFSLPVKTLETYATTGKIAAELASYAVFLQAEQLAQLRQALMTKADLDLVTVSQFLYSPQGEIILKKLGEVVQTGAGQNGFYAIRSALILAAADEQGLTPLNILQKFPTHGIKIASERGFAIFDIISETITQTNKAIAAVENQAIAAVKSIKTPIYAYLPDLRPPGSVNFSKQTLTIKDLARSRVFPVDLYLPEISTSRQVPLIIISHGLGSDRTTFAYLATHLASYGFAVAVPEHPGSNGAQIQALMSGLARDVTPPQELLNRPLDIKHLLDQLELEFSQQIDLKRVGIIGQSFGAYTVLALAGAELNFPQLQQDCQLSNNSVNVSLLLQCLGLKLPIQNYQLQDHRIVAAIAINPLTSSIFGASQLKEIKIPVMLMSGSNDAVTPALSEQILPFTWLTTAQKYLVLMKGGTHFSTLDESSASIPVPAQILGPDPIIAQDYVKALALAFVETYVSKKPEYKRYLESGYAEFLSQKLMPLSLIKGLKFAR